MKLQPPGSFRARTAWLLAGTCFLFNTLSFAGAAAPPSEYQVKIAFLFNFLKFIDFSAPKDPQSDKWMLCIRGPAELISEAKTLDGKIVKGRAVSSSSLVDLAQASHCDVVYLAAGESDALTAVISQAENRSILLVGEDEDFTERGGTIAYYISNSRIRFRINVKNAEQGKLVLSSQLLRLASIEE